MNENQYVTIFDASNMFNVNHTTIYKRIQRGQLKFKEVHINGKKVKHVLLSDIVKLYGEPVEKVYISGSGVDVTDFDEQKPSYEEIKTIFSSPQEESGNENIISRGDIRQEVKKAVMESLQEQQTQLVKPLEEQAMYVAGTLTKENQFLKERLETVLEENRLLQEQLKMLPGPVEEVNENIEKLRLEKEKIEKEKELLEVRQKELDAELHEKLEIITGVKEEKEKLLLEMQKLKDEKSLDSEESLKYKELEKELREKEGRLLLLESEKTELEKERVRLNKLEEENNELRENISVSNQRIKALEAEVLDESNKKVIIHKSLLDAEKERDELKTRMEAEAKEREELQNRLLIEKEEAEARVKEEREKAEKEKEDLAKIWGEELEKERNKPWWRKIFS